MRVLIFILILFLPSYSSAIDLDVFFKAYDQETSNKDRDEKQRLMLEWYAEGVAQGIIYANAIANEKFGKNIFCSPKDLGIGKDFLINLVREWKDELHGTDYPFSLEAMFALEAKFPCN